MIESGYSKSFLFHRKIWTDTYNYADNEVFIAGIMRSESFL